MWNRYQSLILISLVSLNINLNSQPSLAQDIPSQSLLAQTSVSQKGQKIVINGQTFTAAWSQWQQGNITRIGIADTALPQILGIDLLNTNNPQVQPIKWYGKNLSLGANFVAPYRYLDITDLARQAGWQLAINGDNLTLNANIAQIQDIQVVNLSVGKRIVVTLDSQAIWQAIPGNQDGVVKIAANANPSLVQRFKTPTNQTNTNIDTDDVIMNNGTSESGLVLEQASGLTNLKLKIPGGQGLRVDSMASPPSVIIDIVPDSVVNRDILWQNNLRWRQQYVTVGSTKFPVTWLELPLKSPNFSLQPITNAPNTVIGTAPLVTMARNSNVIAAINGGFFNRDETIPLGAIKRNNQWLSSPILNRGAIAWDNQGNFLFDRLSLTETLVTNTGQSFPILFVDSGYVKAGISRYSPQWGSSYTPTTDYETIVVVRQNQVQQQIIVPKAKSQSIPIPSDGYILALKGDNNKSWASQLQPGISLNLQTQTTPADFNRYPNIIAGGPLLIKNQQIVLNPQAENFSDAYVKGTAFRSAIATTTRNTLILTTVYNRVGGKGPTFGELALVMQAMGATNALNLDGGSSSSLYLGGHLIDRSPTTAARVHNGIGIFTK